MMDHRPPAPSPYGLVALECVDSTNAEAKRLAEAGASDLTVVWAKRQTSGRGRRGRAWISQDGNLYCSLVLRPAEPLADVSQLSFVAANAVADTVSQALPKSARVTVKWPNDVLVDGKKIAGILMEGETVPGTDRFAWLVVGIGVNVAAHPPESATKMPATSLAGEGVTGADLNVPRFLDTLVKQVLAGLVTWRSLGFGPIRRQWLSRAQGLGGLVRVRLLHETVHGTFVALDEDGALILHADDQPNRRILAGDLFIVDD